MAEQQPKIYTSNATLHLRDVISVHNDIETVSAYLALIDAPTDNPQQETTNHALWTSALVTFFKCFAGGVRQYKLNKNMFAHLNGEPVEFYDHLKDIRDKHLAHSVSTLEETMVGPILDTTAKRRVGIGRFTIRHVMGTDDTIKHFQTLVTNSQQQIATDLAAAEQKVEAELDNHTYEDMLGWDDLKYTVPEPQQAARKARSQPT